MSFDRDLFLPVSREDMARRGWDSYDILIITGDAYVDHPSFGPTIIGRVLEAEGYRVAVLSQPDWRTPEAFAALGRPRLAVMISAGNLDSMVAHYTAARKRRHDDAYSPGRKAGLRPDHATVVYSNRVREVFGDIPVIIGGLEASPCGASPTTTTGRTRCAGPSSLTPRRTSSPTAWGKRPRWRSSPVWPPAPRWRRSPTCGAPAWPCGTRGCAPIRSSRCPPLRRCPPPGRPTPGPI